MATKAEHFTLIDAEAPSTGARVEQYKGKPYVVVPIVALKEGVIHAMNSDCNEYVPGGELSADGWEGRPIFVGHPLQHGQPVSGQHPAVKDSAVGFTRHASVKDNSLSMEAWVEQEMADQETLDALKANLGMDVSVGVFTKNEDKDGEFGGKSYASIWRGIRPDHLALLPKDEGACNWEMGCGVRSAQMRNAMRVAGPDVLRDGSRTDDHMEAANAHDLAAIAHEEAALQNVAPLAMTGYSATDPRAEKTAQAISASQTADETSKSVADLSRSLGENDRAISLAMDAARVASIENTQEAPSSVAHGTASAHAQAARAHRDAAASHRSAAFDLKMRNAEEGSMDHMYARWLQAGAETDALLKLLRNIPQAERDKMSKDDFAGPNDSFPIAQPVDVYDASRALGRAKGDTGAIKSKIITIAKRKGAAFVAQLPDAWKEPKSAVARAMQGLKDLIDGLSDPTLVDLEGKRNSAADQERVQTMHDKAVEMGATCPASMKGAGAGCSCHKNSSANKESDMADQKARVKTLIGVKASGFTEADAAWLELVPAERLEAFEVLAAAGLRAAGTSKTDAEKVIADKAAADKSLADHAAALKTRDEKKNKDGEDDMKDAIAALKATGKCVLGDEALKACSLAEIKAMTAAAAPVKFEDILKTADAATQDSIREGQRVGEAKKAETIKALKANKNCLFTEEALKAMSQPQLDQLTALAGVKVASVDFSGLGVVREGNSDPSTMKVAAAPSLEAAIKAKFAGKK